MKKEIIITAEEIKEGQHNVSIHSNANDIETLGYLHYFYELYKGSLEVERGKRLTAFEKTLKKKK